MFHRIFHTVTGHRARIGAAVLLTVLTACAQIEKIIPGEETQPPREPVNMPAPPPPPESPVSLMQPPPEAAPPGTPIQVGVLLPLSGPTAAVGEALLDAAQLALEDKYGVGSTGRPGGARIVLLPRDTAGTPERAVSAAQDLINQGVRLIIGPLYGKVAAAVAPVAQQANIPVLSFSNNKAVAGKGIYILGFAPDDQVRRMLDFAHARGLKRFALLAPNSTYGGFIGQAMQQWAAENRGASIERLEFYNPRARSLNQEFQRLGAFYSAETEAPGERRFDALFIVADPSVWPLISAGLMEYGMDGTQVQLLGTRQMQHRNAQVHGGLAGMWFAGTDPHSQLMFERHFFEVYRYPAPDIAGLGYDAASLVASLALLGGQHYLSHATLTQAQGFVGPVHGLFRLTPAGTSQRGYAVLEVTPDRFYAVATAPERF